jgi:hypothetical protein
MSHIQLIFKLQHLLMICSILLWSSGVTKGQQAAIRSEIGNVLYSGIENPISIVMPEKPCKAIVAKASHGKLTREAKTCLFYYKNDSCELSGDMIIVGYTSKAGIIWTDTSFFRVLSVPQPVPFVSGVRKGNITTEQLLAGTAIHLNLLGFFIEGVKFSVGSYSVDIIRGDSLIFRQTGAQGNRFTPELTAMIQLAEPGDIYLFYDIICTNCSCWNIPPPIELRVVQ